MRHIPLYIQLLIWIYVVQIEQTNYMKNLLIDNGLTFSQHYDLNLIKRIKATNSRISSNYKDEENSFKVLGASKDLAFELSDKKSINIGFPHIQCAEA